MSRARSSSDLRQRAARMTDKRNEPPDPPPCLSRLRAPGQKGGTLIAEGVLDHETHVRRLRNPDGYRPISCPSCQATILHIHDYRERKLRAEADRPVTTV